MMDSQNLPGGAPRQEFRDAINNLAKEAGEQDRLAAEEARRRLARRPISRFIRIGVALAVLELVVFGILYGFGRRHQQASRKTAQPNSAMLANDCAGVVYRTYWKIAAYIRDQGHPPPTLNDLVGAYVDKLPADPATGTPLQYSTDGTQFDIRCPGAARRR
jgi:hypothetical protein